jgi:acetolactate synthase small subunit
MDSPATTHHTIHARSHHAHTVLPRILLTFSRRRLRIQALHYFHLDATADSEIQIDLECEPRMAAELTAQLRRIVEVKEVWSEVVPVSRAEQRLAVA